MAILMCHYLSDGAYNRRRRKLLSWDSVLQVHHWRPSPVISAAAGHLRVHMQLGCNHRHDARGWRADDISRSARVLLSLPDVASASGAFYLISRRPGTSPVNM